MLISWLLDQYEGKLHLEVTADNLKAVKFYHGIGLKVTGEYESKDKVKFLKFSSCLLES